jgi:hypothetical protein
MKLPASVLAALCLTGVAGCETTVDFERRSTPPAKAPVVVEKGEVEHVEIELGRVTYAKPPPAAAPITKPTPKPRSIPTKLVPVPAPKPLGNVCGPCGMG